jgi:hypothetical protein
MPFPMLDRNELLIKPLRARQNKLAFERVQVSPDAHPRSLSSDCARVVAETVRRIQAARADGKPVILAFGAHTVKNGLAPVLIKLIEHGCVTHLATNGAGIIHDWEFAFQGESGEDVRLNVDRGEFGLWEETGRYLNLALVVGAWEGLGYGESVGAMIQNEGLRLPAAGELRDFVTERIEREPERCAAAADLLDVSRRFGLAPGLLAIAHAHKALSLQAAAYRLKVPCTGHPMIGHDIIYNHPMNHGAAIGRTALRDFLSFADSVSRIDGGVYLSVGSAVMSPMIFEKALAMAQNLHAQRGAHVERHFIVVVDLAESAWNWKEDGEPPQDHPAYYLRYCKTFSRMGGEMRYVCADNRDFLLALWQGLRKA